MKVTSWQSSSATPLANCTTTKSTAVPGGPSAAMGACQVPAPSIRWEDEAVSLVAGC